jgi:hypothetical protein
VYLRSWDAFVGAGGRGMMMSHNEVPGCSMRGYRVCHAVWT